MPPINRVNPLNRPLPKLNTIPISPTRQINQYNVFLKANKGKFAGMSRSDISWAYRESQASDNFPNYEPKKERTDSDVDSDEEPIDDWMRTHKNTDDYVDRMRLDELAQFGTARQTSNAAL